MKKILVSLPDGIFSLIQELKGDLGESDSEVVRNIVVAYLSEQGFFSQTSIRGIASRNRRNTNKKEQQQ